MKKILVVNNAQMLHGTGIFTYIYHFNLSHGCHGAYGMGTIHLNLNKPIQFETKVLGPGSPGVLSMAQVGDEVTKDEPLTTNPNVGGFGQAVEKVGRWGF